MTKYLQSALADLLDQQMKPKVRFSTDVEDPEGHFSTDRCANCRTYRGQISSLQEEISTLRHENKKLLAKVEMLDTQLQETQKYDKEHQASLTNKCNSLEDELNKMHEKYRVSLEENSRIKLELAKSDSTYERRKDADTIEQLQQRLNSKSHECASLREQLTEIQQQRERERQREQDWLHDPGSRYENVMTKGPGGNGSGYNLFKYEFDVDKDSLMPSLCRRTQLVGLSGLRDLLQQLRTLEAPRAVERAVHLSHQEPQVCEPAVVFQIAEPLILQKTCLSHKARKYRTCTGDESRIHSSFQVGCPWNKWNAHTQHTH